MIVMQAIWALEPKWKLFLFVYLAFRITYEKLIRQIKIVISHSLTHSFI